MGNFFDYIYWRGDLSEESCKFSGVDFAILSQLAFLDINKVFTDDTVSLTIKDAYEAYSKVTNLDANVGLIFSNSPKNLFKALAKAHRFKDLIMSDYVHTYDEENFEQFAGVTFTMPSGAKIIAFSGTDDTLVGWKEDFMLIYKDKVSAHNSSLKYLQRIADKTDKIYITGHSKGAHLAMFTLFYSSYDVYKKIVSVSAFDGPGFYTPILDEDVLTRSKKLIEYLPQTSLFGRLFNHYGKQKIVSSTFNGAFQHDIFSWEIERNRFVKRAHFEEISDKTDEKIKDILSRLTVYERQKLVETVFDVLSKTGAKTLTELSLMKLETVKCFWTIPPEDRKFIAKIFLGEFLKDKNIRNMFLNDMFDKKATSVIKNSRKYAIDEYAKAKKDKVVTKQDK
jgi:hypothetical protein